MEFLKENSEIFSLLFEGISEGIVVVNNNQIVVSTNLAADEMFGYEKGELIGESLEVLIPENFRHNHGQHVKNFTSNSKRRKMGESQDLHGLRKDNSLFALEAGLNPFAIYDKKYVMALIVDITERKKQEREIKSLNEGLERMVKDRTIQLNETIGSLKEEVQRRIKAETKTREALNKEKDLNELKTKFLSLVSHEFKTPLTGISTSATLIGKYKKTEQQEKREKHLNTIKSKVKYLDSILNEFLSIERLESGKVNYNYKSISIRKIYDDVRYEAQMMLKEGQEIVCESNIDNLWIEFDEKILELILFNLIHNAIKYSDENTDVFVSFTPKGEKLFIRVKDEGIGIPETEQKFIFKRYFRAKNAVLNQGTGIGLNILKSHLENLGGNISFISKENEGSTFSIEIPIKPV